MPMEICGPPSTPPLRAAWKSLLKSETARMLPISVVHGQIDDEIHGGHIDPWCA